MTPKSKSSPEGNATEIPEVPAVTIPAASADKFEDKSTLLRVIDAAVTIPTSRLEAETGESAVSCD